LADFKVAVSEIHVYKNKRKKNFKFDYTHISYPYLLEYLFDEALIMT